jgi:hypothetical protein
VAAVFGRDLIAHGLAVGVLLAAVPDAVLDRFFEVPIVILVGIAADEGEVLVAASGAVQDVVDQMAADVEGTAALAAQLDLVPDLVVDRWRRAARPLDREREGSGALADLAVLEPAPVLDLGLPPSVAVDRGYGYQERR